MLVLERIKSFIRSHRRVDVPDASKMDIDTYVSLLMEDQYIQGLLDDAAEEENSANWLVADEEMER